MRIIGVNMLDKLIQVLIDFGKDVLPFYIVEEWSRGLHFRFGHLLKTCTPGFHWKIPFVDSVYQTLVITQSLDMNPQSITTSDDKSIVAKGVIRYHVVDVQPYMFRVHPADALVDTAQSIIRHTIETKRWEELKNIGDELTVGIANEVKEWGIVVEQVTLTDLALIKSIRVIQNGTNVQATANQIEF